MDFFKNYIVCRACGRWSLDGDEVNQICAFCVLADFGEENADDVECFDISELCSQTSE